MELLQLCKKCGSYQLETYPITKYRVKNGSIITVEMVLCLDCDYAFKRRVD